MAEFTFNLPDRPAAEKLVNEMTPELLLPNVATLAERLKELVAELQGVSVQAGRVLALTPIKAVKSPWRDLAHDLPALLANCVQMEAVVECHLEKFRSQYVAAENRREG